MQHEIKINRSRKLAAFLPRADAEIMASISPLLIEQLTAAQLAEVRRCLNAHWHKAREFERLAILAEGGVWSEGANAGAGGFRKLDDGVAR